MTSGWRTSDLVKSFNDQFGNIRWEDRDRVIRLLTKDIPEQVSTNRAYQNAMKNSDPQNARIEHDKALQKAMNNVVKDDTELFRKFSEDQLFAKWLSDRIFQITYKAVQGAQISLENVRAVDVVAVTAE